MDAQQLFTGYLAFCVALLGAAMGSFLACAADRHGLPTGRSRCDSCGHVLGLRDLVPLFSFLLSRGKCRYCGAPIPLSCLAAEGLGALAFGALTLRFGPSPQLGMLLGAAALLLLLSLIDWKEHILPDRLLLVLGVWRLFWAVLLGENWRETLPTMLLGALSVSLPLLVLSLVMDRLLGKETMGGGDIKLLFVLGLYQSWLQMILLVFCACVLALLFAALGKSRGKEIPFGPFLAMGWLVVTLWGEGWVQWYLSLLM